MLENKRPKCGCGNTQNPIGYCDGSNAKKNYCSGIGVITIYIIFDLMNQTTIFNNWWHTNNLQNS